MKLVEATIDEEKENACNGNGISEKTLIKTMTSSQPSNGDILNDSGSNDSAGGVGDLLVEDTNQRSNDEEIFQNGSKGDDSTSISSSSSNFRNTEQDLSEEDMTLIDEEEEGLPLINETDSNLFFSSSPESNEDKKEATSTSALEETIETSSSEKTKDNDTSKEEKICNNQSESEKSSSSEKYDKSDDNLEHFISDLKQSTTAIPPETKNVTISELRKEIEDFIKNHDNDESSTENENKILSQESENSTADTETDIRENQESEIKSSDETEIKVEDQEMKFEDNDIKDDGIDIKIEENLNKNDDLLTPKSEFESCTSTSNEINEETTEIISENTKKNIEDANTEYDNKNKHSESMDIDETKATENIEINKLKTNESDSSTCQQTVDDLDKIETENNKIVEEKSAIVPVIEKCSEDKNEDNTKNSSLKPMEIDITGNETEAVPEKNKSSVTEEKEDETTINTDDVEMKDDFVEIKKIANKKHEEKFKINEETSREEAVTDIQEESLLIEDKKREKKSVEETEDNKIEKKEDNTKEETKGYDHNDRPGEERPSLKRTLEAKEENQEAKKPKINGVKKPDSDKVYVKLDSFRDFMSKKEISILTRTELEEFCLQKMCEVITQTSVIGELNRKVIQHETMLDSYRTKYNSVSKQIRDLEIVHSKVLQEIRTKAKESNIEVTPVKITRSVGLQVSLQPIAGRVRQLVPPQETVPPGGVKRKIQRASLPNNVPSTSSTPNIMPPPSRPLIHKSPSQGKGIKTILPKVYPPAEPKDPNPPNSSLLGSYLQNPGPSKTPTTPPVRKPSPTAVPSTSAGPSDSSPKVIDLTDEDDVQKATGSSSAGNIRVVSPQQLQGTISTPVTSPTVTRVSYVMPQQVLLASTAPRPGGQRSTVMFKPVAPGQVPPGQRLNIVRPNQVPGITVLPSTSSAQIRPGQQIRFATTVAGPRPAVRASAPARHPAPLPGPPAVQPSQPNWKAMPPKPTLKISRVGDGIVLSWKMQNNKDMSLYEDIGSYQLYAYQETNGPPNTDMWRKVGDVKALALPMACTLTQFTDGNKYHFAVRAVDVKSRVGPFSQPEQIALP